MNCHDYQSVCIFYILNCQAHQLVRVSSRVHAKQKLIIQNNIATNYEPSYLYIEAMQRCVVCQCICDSGTLSYRTGTICYFYVEMLGKSYCYPNSSNTCSISDVTTLVTACMSHVEPQYIIVVLQQRLII